jgi:predicted AAA+ superfamily ATPase
MMNKNRTILETLRSRLEEKRPLIQVLVGPRQVGKTTALRAALDNRGVYESADYPTALPLNSISDWWNRALQVPERILAIDEVQKITGWSEVVKKRWDEDPHALKVILTGSSALLLEKGLTETLAGRFEVIRAPHWNFAEARDVFKTTLNGFVEFGCYPGSMHLVDNVERWAAYIRDSIVEPALGRDLLALHPVENPALLRQVFGVTAALPAQIVSLQKLLGQLQHRGSLPTLQNYLHLLGEAFLVTGVGKYSGQALRTRKSPPKLIVHDNALMRAFERPVGEPLSPDRFGHYFENAVCARFIEAGWDTFYWKDRDAEVDIVALGPGGEKWAIEIKSSNASINDFRGLKRFVQTHKEFEPHLVSLVGQEIPGISTLDAAQILSLERHI